MFDTCFDILRQESNLKFITVSAGTNLLPRISAGKNGASSACCLFFLKTINSVYITVKFYGIYVYRIYVYKNLRTQNLCVWNFYTQNLYVDFIV